MTGSAKEVDSHQVPCHARSKQIGAVDVDAPQLPHSVDRVGDGLKVLREARGRHKIVDLAVLSNDLGDASQYAGLVGDVGVVGCDFGQPRGVGVFLLEGLDDVLRLDGCFFLCVWC